MNHLKCMRINLPRRAPSNAALPSYYGHYIDVRLKNCQFRPQFSGSHTLSIAKKSHGVGIKYPRQFCQDSLRLVSKESKTICKQRSRTKSSVISLKKKSSLDKRLPLERIAGTACNYSTCQNVTFKNTRINKGNMSQSAAIINGAKDANRHNSFIASAEKHCRSYAEMIADYSEILYKAPAVSLQNDSLYFNNTIRKSPFSTFSTSSSAKEIVNITEHSGVPSEERKDRSRLHSDSEAIKLSDRRIRHDNISTVEYRDFQHYDERTTEVINKDINQHCATNDLARDDQSYVRLVADCSKSMHNISFSNISYGGLAPRRSVLAKSSLESFATPTRKASSTNTQETLRGTIPAIATVPLGKKVEEQTTDSKKDWSREIKNVISDLKSVTERKTATTFSKIPKSKENEKDILRPVSESGSSLNRVHRLTELKTHEPRKEDIADKELGNQFDEIDKVEKHKKNLNPRKYNYSQLSDTTSNLPRYFSNAAPSSSVRKNSTQAFDTTVTLTQPQVKLHMVPSEKESIVSINVDSAATGPLDPASKQLSVIVQSDQKGDQQSNQWNAPTHQRGSKSAPRRSDFGPMRISISEDSAPIKQIEFSINGKPVSELKSITARTEKLDVVSSVDKIEIRIPFAKDADALGKTKEDELSKGADLSMEQILNVQISANFQNKSAKDSTEKPAEKINATSTSFPQTSKTHHVFNKSAKVHDKIPSSNDMQHISSSQIDIKSNNTTERNINEHKILGDTDLQRETTLSADKTMTNVSLIEKVNSLETRKLTKIINTTRSPETNMYNKYKSTDYRIPSKMIPWWSSSDSFNKIKKEEDNHKPFVPVLNRHEKKMIPNLNKNFVTESSTLKETSSSKVLTKKIQSTNNATANNSNNLISYSNSLEQCVESKPTLHYSCLFRLKPKRENHDIMRNDVKTEDNQMSIVREGNTNISEIKQTKSTISDIVNIQGKQDTDDKASILSKKVKAPNSAQNSLSKRNQEKKYNSLKSKKLTDNITNTKSKIENILDIIKPIEKRKDGTLIDYGVKMSSRKLSAKLNSRIKEIQNPPPIAKTKDLVLDKSMMEMRKQIDNTMSINQIESEEKKKLEIKMDTSKGKEDLTMENIADIKMQNDIKNVKKVCKNNTITLNSPNFRDPLKSMQTLQKQEKLAEDTIISQNNFKHDLKESNKNRSSSLSSLKTSSGTMQKSEKVGIVDMRVKNLSNKRNAPEMTKIQASEKLSSTSKLEGNPSKKFSPNEKIADQKKSFLKIVNEIQTKSNKSVNKITNTNQLFFSQIKPSSASKVKNSAVPKNSIDKNVETLIANQAADKSDTKNKTAKITTQNAKSKDSLPKNCEENRLHKSKSGKDRGSSSRSTGSLKKPNGLTDFTSSGPKMNVTSRVISNDNCTYAGKLLFMGTSYSNFDRKDKTLLNSQRAVFKIPRNLNGVDMLEHHAPSVIGSATPWTNIDRPEKSMLYSVWLQRSRSDTNNKEKLF